MHAAVRSASRTPAGRDASRRETRLMMSPGTGGGASGSSGAPSSARAISMAARGLPRAPRTIRCTASSVVRVAVRYATRLARARSLSGPISTRRSRVGGTARSTARGAGPSPMRAPASTPTGLSLARRTASSTACALAGSSQCRSSSTSSSGVRRARSASRVARPAATVCHSEAVSPGSMRRRATSTARRWGAGSPASSPSSTSASNSMRAACGSWSSRCDGLHDSVRTPRAAASAAIASMRVVLPMPGSPSSNSAHAPSRRSSRSRAAASISACRSRIISGVLGSSGSRPSHRPQEICGSQPIVLATRPRTRSWDSPADSGLR